MSLSSRRTRRVALGSLFAMTMAMTSLTVFADNKADAAKGKKEVTLGLEGYCPVCIVDGKKWVRGNPQHEVTYDGKTYHFPGEKQKQKFLANPTRYVPALGGDCTVCYAKVGKRVRGNIHHAVFHNERLYLFPSEKEKAAFLGSPKEFAEVDLALDGKCAVCRTNAGKNVPGKSEFATIHQGLRYQFPSAKERDVFLADPSKYAVKSAVDAQTSLKKNTEKAITIKGKSTCAGCEHGLVPIGAPDTLGLAINATDGKVYVIEDAHKLYPDIYKKRFDKLRLQVTGTVLKRNDKATWVQPSQLKVLN